MGLAAAVVMDAALTGVNGMLLVYCRLSVLWLSVLWLSTLRGVRSCRCCDGLGCRLGLLGLFVFRLLLLGFV